MLKHQRTKCGLTLEELAKKLGTDRHYVWKLENGKINMSLNYLDMALKKLNINPENFFLEFISNNKQ